MEQGGDEGCYFGLRPVLKGLRLPGLAPWELPRSKGESPSERWGAGQGQQARAPSTARSTRLFAAVAAPHETGEDLPCTSESCLELKG